jgi:DNA-directed RNA polymerase subunit RPC12/RpoP
MASELKPCKECGSETTVTTLSAFSGEEGPVRVTIDGMPAVVCANNHKRFVYADFAPMLLDFVADPEKVAPQPPAAKKGLIKKHYHCSGCGEELPADPTSESSRTLDATLKKAAPFRIAVRVALYKCEQCGREQVRSNDDLSENVVKAISHGFRAMDIHADR